MGSLQKGNEEIDKKNLAKELCHDAVHVRLRAVAAIGYDGVNLIDEYDAWHRLARHGKECLDQSLALTHVLVNQRRGRHAEKGASRLAGNGPSNVSLACARWPIQ